MRTPAATTPPRFRRARPRGRRGTDAGANTEPLNPSQLDTVGWVEIRFGRNARQVKEGLALCGKARDAGLAGAHTEFESLTRAYYDYHKRMADYRLLVGFKAV